MNFGEILKQMLGKVDGAIGALIMGLDGIAIEQRFSENVPRDSKLGMIAAAYATLLRNSMRTTKETGVGQLEEISVIAENMVLVIKLINTEYFLMMALEQGGNIGRARFELKKAQLMLEEEFAF
ncbi:MAG: roadblock/LC7 domain-containing protein [Acidobacteriota bacterium]|nr:roadblock/LC7 domain-containing protein [Blastocatellia bacterium]MDW8413352.1 roadblock/LC7 domain-containing protein [Acidobacteriota bacterium]